MDIDDINNRMERVYLSIGQRFDKNIEQHIKIEHKRNGKHWQAEISFGGDNKAELLNQIFNIISHIAKLKDHLKNLYISKGGDGRVVEDEVELSEDLKLVLDLDNKEKHGKLKKHHSGKDPYLDEIDRALSAIPGKQSEKVSFSIDPFSGQYCTEGPVAIVITAQVKSNNGTRVCSLDELINNSMGKWEEIIKKYNITESKN